MTTGESLAIILMLLVMAFMFLRAGKRMVAFLVLPLVCVPVGYLLSGGVYTAVAPGYPFRTLAICFVLGGLLLNTGICWRLARTIPTKRGSYAYLVFTLLFAGLLTLAYLLRMP